MSIIISLIFFAGCILGIPIAFAFGLAGLTGLWMSGLPVELMASKMMFAINIFPLLAIPFFMLAGELMVRAGIVRIGINVANAVIGRVPGSLGHVTVLSELGLSAVSGTAVADAAALGSAFLKPLSKAYGLRYGAALIAAAANLGPILPPSTAMIVYASIAGPGVSVPALFLGGILPAFVIAGGMWAYIYFSARMRNFPLTGDKFNFRTLVKETIVGFPVLVLPVIIIGGIIGGAFTATEGGAVAVVLALLMGFFYTKELTVKDVIESLLNAGMTTGAVAVIIAFASTVTFLFSIDHLPDMLSSFVRYMTSDPTIFLIIIFLILVVVGMFMESTAAYVMLVPIFAPMAVSYGVDPLHFALLFILTLIVGMLTPPVGVLLFVMCGISGLKMGELLEEVWPYIAIQFGATLAILFFPSIFLWLPRVVGY